MRKTAMLGTAALVASSTLGLGADHLVTLAA
jgi:hypothetical protein